MAKVDQIRQKAAELFQRGDYAKAVAEYKKVLQEEPNNAQTYNFIGDAYIKLNNIDEAMANYREAMKYYSSDALYNNAIAICRKILRYRKDDVELYKTLGELYIHQGLINEAITNLLEYAERMMREGRQDQAFPVYAQIVELNPQNLNARAKLADLYLAQKRTAEAINEFSHLAQAYRDQGRQIEAEALEARIRTMRGEAPAPAAAPPAVEIKPAVVLEELLQQKQEISSEPAAPEQTAPMPQIVIEREPSAPVEAPAAAKQDWATNIELGDLLVEIGSIQEALDQYHSAASGYLGDGNVEKAVEIYKKIAEIQPLELRSRQKLVEIALQSNQPEAIIEAYLGLAECLRRRELKEQAAAVYQKILEIDPVNEMALENLSLLLPELPEGSVEIPGIEVHAEPQYAAPAPAEPEISVPPPPVEAEPFTMPQPVVETPAQPEPQWTPAPVEEQSFIVQAEPETPATVETEVQAGEPVADVSKVHWGREIVEGGRQSRVKFSVADEQPQAPAAQEEFLSLSEILAEFKEGVFQQVGKEEYRQHYDLGISYKEMGLLEEAISEFQLASKGEQERLAAFEMLGLCFMERGEPKFAVKQFERGIATPGHSEEEYLGLYYYLGMAYEQMGDLDKAREAYENVYNVDINFRDVRQKLLALGSGAVAASEPEPVPAVEPAPAATPPISPMVLGAVPSQPKPRPPSPAQPVAPQATPPPQAAPRPVAASSQPAPVPQVQVPPISQPKPARPAMPSAPYQTPITPAAQPTPVRPAPRPAPAPAPQPVPQAPPSPRPMPRPAPLQPAVAESEPAPKPKPIPSKLKKPDKQRISYV